MPEEFRNINRVLAEIREASPGYRRRRTAKRVVYACVFMLSLIVLVAVLGAG